MEVTDLSVITYATIHFLFTIHCLLQPCSACLLSSQLQPHPVCLIEANMSLIVTSKLVLKPQLQ